VRHWLACLWLLGLAACTQPEDASTKIVVGATLAESGTGRLIEHSIVIVDDGIVRAVGPQESVAVPRGSKKINGLGKFIRPLDPSHPVRAGETANFGLYDAHSHLVGRMIGPRWEPVP